MNTGKRLLLINFSYVYIISCRMVNYDGLKKQAKYGLDHWKKYHPTSIQNLLLGTTWIFFYRHYVGMRQGLFKF